MANTNLMIVESPAKAKTIKKFLGDGFEVTSCYGHIRDLPSKDLSVDTENGFTPEYVVPKEKQDIVKQLKKLAKSADRILLATDEDREGEAISWHLCEILGIAPEAAERIVFHEITNKAINEAMAKPRPVNSNLVDAQQARRILDRLVGFEISPILWRKVAMRKGLSAGRVQSVAVRLIVERERAIAEFESKASFKVSALFEIPSETGTAQLKAALATNLASEEIAMAFLQDCLGADFDIADIQVKPAKKSPAAPFTTSTLQQEASRKLGFGVKRTMSVAQSLYESGRITYMRTDSVNLSDTAVQAAKAEIVSQWGEEYSKPRQFKTKSAGAQEAHEAIRPTDMSAHTVEGRDDEQRLYELIWKRSVASQMAEAQLERTTVSVGISTRKETLQAKGEVIKFDGFLKLYIEGTDEEGDEDESGLLPPMTKGQKLNLISMTAAERFTRPPARFTEATLVRQLEELGIGRPSTYAPTISTVQDRGYVEKTSKEGVQREYRVLSITGGQIESKLETETTGAEKNKLFPTDIGMLVNDFLVEHFTAVLDYGFTANIEQRFDDIAEGNRKWVDILEEFYGPFHKIVEDTLQNAERVTGERFLGDHPEDGRPVYARMGKYGPMIQVGQVTDEEKPRFAKLRKDQSMNTIELDDALELFKLPRSLGMFEETEVIVSEGRFGPYVRHQDKFYSLKEIAPMEITLEQASQVIIEGREKDKNKTIHDFSDHDIQVLRGPYGPYIKHAKRNYRIPKTVDAEKLNLEECQEIIKNAPPPKKRGRKKA